MGTKKRGKMADALEEKVADTKRNKMAGALEEKEEKGEDKEKKERE